MAKKSMVEKNKHRALLVKQYAGRRKKLKALADDKAASNEDRFAARLKLAELPRNSAPSRLRNRCELSGRPRGFVGKMKMSRIAVRDLGARGLIPGLVKSSW